MLGFTPPKCGGAIPDSVMRYLNENPWDRLEKIKAVTGDSSKLTALSRGRNLFGYNPYPDDIIEGFCKHSIKSGLDIMRIFDALNDIENMKSTIKAVKKHGGIVDCAVCYTVDPKFTFMDKVKSFRSGKKLPGQIFTHDYFINKAVELEKLGADMITIKDMAGLIPPDAAAKIVKGIKDKVKLPLDLHTHCTPGYGLATVLVGIMNGVDIVDTVIMPFAGGPAAPAFELIKIFADKLNIEIDVDLEAIEKIKKELFEIRKELAPFDQLKQFPKDIDITNYKLSSDIDSLFNKAIEYAKEEKFDELLKATLKIEEYFNFPAPNENVKNAEIPGGMYTNMTAQLKAVKLEHLMNRVLAAVPKVRLDAGLPPLVTPTSQIVGAQAVNCIIDENKGLPWYTNKSVQFVNLVKGSYGKTPFPVDPDFREKLAGVREETPYDTSTHQVQENPILEEAGGIQLAEDEKEMLLIELFPQVAKGYLKNKKVNAYVSEKEAEIEREKRAYRELPAEEKEKIILDGLQSFCY